MTKNNQCFSAIFQLEKLVSFQLEYMSLTDGGAPVLTSSCFKLSPDLLDFKCCGQYHERLLRNHLTVKKIWLKWHDLMLTQLNDDQYIDLQIDLMYLCNRFNYIIKLVAEPFNLNDFLKLAKMGVSKKPVFENEFLQREFIKCKYSVKALIVKINALRCNNLGMWWGANFITYPELMLTMTDRDLTTLNNWQFKGKN